MTVVATDDWQNLDERIRRHAAEVMRAARGSRSLSQLEAAGMVGVTQAALSNYERGIHLMRLDFAVLVCRAYGLTMAELTGIEGL